MVSIFFSWIIILMAALIWGGAFSRWYSKKELYTVDETIASGVMLLTVYAEAFSLFYKVGRVAVAIMMIVSLVILIFLLKKKNVSIVGLCEKIRKEPLAKLIVILSVFFIMAMWTNGVPLHPDSHGYHYPSIAWVENYGVVKGLGNLHNRYAYNSAFICLQALFSFKWLFGQSLHTVNGFISAAMLAYCLCSNGLCRRKPICLSDLLKFSTIVYIFYNRNFISSPSTDTFPMLLIFYIAIKWTEFYERDEKDTDIYAWLCVLGGFAISVKLSSMACGLLIIYPLFVYWKEKKWILIAKNGIIYLLVLIPWLVRNVIISGYLLYPYAQIDLFPVDWKMPKAVVIYDNWEIMTHGRGLIEAGDALKHDWSFFRWLPEWFHANSGIWAGSGMIAGMILSVLLILYILYVLCKRRYDCREMLFVIYACIGFFMWLFSAPQIRFGVVYILMLISISAYEFLLKRTRGKVNRLLCGGTRYLMIILVVMFLAAMGGTWVHLLDYQLILQENYRYDPTQRIDYEGFSVWYPIEGSCSYDVFPTSLYPIMVDKIELRGSSLEQGFKMKDEYMNDNLKNDGEHWYIGEEE